MREREFRFLRFHTSLPQASDLVRSFATVDRPLRTYTLHYLADHFRFKRGRWEIKSKISTFAYFHAGLWLKFVESEETPYAHWTRDDCRRFYRRIATRQMPVVHEYRYEVRLGRKAKLYAFHKPSDRLTGLVFEIECADARLGPVVLSPYVHVLRALDREGSVPIPARQFLPCRRKPVVHVDWPPEPLMNRTFIAVKQDGVFGWVYSYSPDYLFEKWEDNRQHLRPGLSLGGPGGSSSSLLMAAERLPDGRVVLLDVYQAEGARVYRRDVRHVLGECLPALRIPDELKDVYSVQRYYTSVSSVVDAVEGVVEGFIFHTFADRVYKLKRSKTVDLMHEGGFFVSSRGERFRAPEGLRDGRVYECDVGLNVLRVREDRFCGNTPEQLARIGPVVVQSMNTHQHEKKRGRKM